MGNIGDEVKKLYSEELKEKNGRDTINSVTNKKNRTTLYVILIIAVVINFLAGSYYWNKFVRLQQEVYARKGQMEKEFQRRNDLIPDLIDVAKDYARHERELFRYVADAKLNVQSTEKLKEAIKKLRGIKAEEALSKLLALAEQYPDLKATQSFQDLMEKLEETENRIANMRESYNKAAQVYNVLVVSFPSNIFNVGFRFKQMAYFQADIIKTPLIGEGG